MERDHTRLPQRPRLRRVQRLGPRNKSRDWPSAVRVGADRDPAPQRPQPTALLLLQRPRSAAVPVRIPYSSIRQRSDPGVRPQRTLAGATSDISPEPEVERVTHRSARSTARVFMHSQEFRRQEAPRCRPTERLRARRRQSLRRDDHLRSPRRTDASKTTESRSRSRGHRLPSSDWLRQAKPRGVDTEGIVHYRCRARTAARDSDGIHSVLEEETDPGSHLTGILPIGEARVSRQDGPPEPGPTTSASSACPARVRLADRRRPTQADSPRPITSRPSDLAGVAARPSVEVAVPDLPPGYRPPRLHRRQDRALTSLATHAASRRRPALDERRCSTSPTT